MPVVIVAFVSLAQITDIPVIPPVYTVNFTIQVFITIDNVRAGEGPLAMTVPVRSRSPSMRSLLCFAFALTQEPPVRISAPSFSVYENQVSPPYLTMYVLVMESLDGQTRHYVYSSAEYVLL